MCCANTPCVLCQHITCVLCQHNMCAVPTHHVRVVPTQHMCVVPTQHVWPPHTCMLPQHTITNKKVNWPRNRATEGPRS